MASLIVILILIIALLLGAVVLVQNPKGGGLAVGFQGATQVSGVQRTTEFLEKATWYLAIALFVLCMISAKWYTTSKFDEGGTEPAATEAPANTGQSGDQAPANP